MRLFVYSAAWILLGLLAFLPLDALADTDREVQGVDSGILSEIRVGALRHDASIFTTRQEEAVIDANLEILFTSPRFMRYVWSPRPHLGVTANFAGETSQAYLGLTWDVDLLDGLFAELGLGASVHNGELDSGDPAKKNLGCRWLFRESVSLGYRISEHHNISMMLDHLSNGELCDPNKGLDALGIRWGYRF